MAESKSKEKAKEKLKQQGKDDEEAEAVLAQFPDEPSMEMTMLPQANEARTNRESGFGIGRQVYSYSLVILITVILTLEHLLERLRMTKFNSTHYDDPLFRKVSFFGLLLSIISLFVAIFALVGEGWNQSGYLILLFAITTVFFLHSTIAGGIRSVR